MMKKIYQAGMAALTVALFMGAAVQAAADEEKALPQLVISNAYDWYSSGDPDYIELYKGYYELAYLDSESAELYPELDEALLKWSRDRQTGMKETNSDMQEMAQEYFDEEARAFPLEFESYLYVRRTDDKALSLLSYSYSYSGGVHGYYWYNGLNLDVQTGEEITLDQVFADPDSLPELLQGILEKNYPDSVLSDLCELTEETAAADSEPTDLSWSWNWTLDPEGVTFYFNPYEIACYADGALTAFVPFEGNEDLFTGKYTKQKGCWAMGIPNYLEQNFRRSDGSWHKLSVSSYPDEYGSYENIDISVDHETSSFNDLWYYSGKIYLVRTANGANYIYASLHADNDYSFLVVYDLYRRPYKVGEIQGAFDTDYERASELQMADGSCFCAFSHPEHFTMSTIIQYMSTVSGEREYEPGADGMPRPLTPYYEVDFVRELTAKVDLTLPSVTYSEDDPSLAGVTGGNVEIKAGEKLAFWRTDGDNYMDLKREDGSAVRCVLDESMGWPYYVNGVALESAFDGIIFAG